MRTKKVQFADEQKKKRKVLLIMSYGEITSDDA